IGLGGELGAAFAAEDGDGRIGAGEVFEGGGFDRGCAVSVGRGHGDDGAGEGGAVEAAVFGAIEKARGADFGGLLFGDDRRTFEGDERFAGGDGGGGIRFYVEGAGPVDVDRRFFSRARGGLG